MIISMRFLFCITVLVALSGCAKTYSSAFTQPLQFAQAAPQAEEVKRGPCPGFSSGIAELEYVMAEHNKNL